MVTSTAGREGPGLERSNSMNRPPRLSPVAAAVAFGFFVAALSAALGSTHDLAWPILVLNVWAAVVTVRIMLHYHRTTDWQDSPIGRTTMGIKGAILMLVGVGIGRRTAEVAAVFGLTELRHVAHDVTDMILTTAWVLLAVVLTLRLRVIKGLQSSDSSEPEPPH